MKVAYKKLTFRQLFSPTIAKRSDRHFEKMTLGDLSKSSKHDKNVLVVRGRFCYLATFPLWRAGRLQDPSENAHYEVTYSALYFTWKWLPEIVKMPHICAT